MPRLCPVVAVGRVVTPSRFTPTADKFAESTQLRAAARDCRRNHLIPKRDRVCMLQDTLMRPSRRCPSSMMGRPPTPGRELCKQRIAADPARYTHSRDPVSGEVIDKATAEPPAWATGSLTSRRRPTATGSQRHHRRLCRAGRGQGREPGRYRRRRHERQVASAWSSPRLWPDCPAISGTGGSGRSSRAALGRGLAVLAVVFTRAAGTLRLLINPAPCFGSRYMNAGGIYM